MKKIIIGILIFVISSIAYADVYKFNYCTDEEELGRIIFFNKTNDDLLVRYNFAGFCKIITLKKGETIKSEDSSIDIDNGNVLLDVPVVFETKTINREDKSVCWMLETKGDDILITLEENIDNWHF